MSGAGDVPTREGMLPLPAGGSLRAEEADGRLRLRLEDRPLASLALRRQEAEIVLAAPRLAPDEPGFAVWAASYWLLARDPACQVLRWELPEPPGPALRSGLLVPTASGCLTRRDLFWQLAQPWLPGPSGAAYPQSLRLSQGRRHPARPPKPAGELYRRFDVRLGQWISLRALDLDRDLERFHRWQNLPRVAHFWQEGGTREQHRAYLQKLAEDPHTLTVIGCFDEEPFAYLELYWAKEDRIAPFYDVDDYDRGIHMLVGEEAHRGPHKVASWLSALAHYLFLDDPRTRSIVSEPRADNARMIAHLAAQGFYRAKDFDFPHKRATLMRLTRELFFDRCVLA